MIRDRCLNCNGVLTRSEGGAFRHSGGERQCPTNATRPGRTGARAVPTEGTIVNVTTLDALASAAKVAAKAQAKAEAAQEALTEAVANYSGNAETAANVLGVSVRTYWRMRKAGSPAPTPVKDVVYSHTPEPTPKRPTGGPCETCWDAGAYGGCVECGKVEP